MEMNREVFRLINDIGKNFGFLDPIVYAIAEWSVFALAVYMVIAYLLGAIRGSEMKTKTIFMGGISFICSYVVCKLLGKLHYNEQPFAEMTNVHQLVFKDVDNSFPSDHTALFFSIIFAFYFSDIKYKWWLVLPFVMAFSRVYVGVHYPYDVAAAGAVGIVVAFATVKVLKNNNTFSKFNGQLANVINSFVKAKRSTGV